MKIRRVINESKIFDEWKNNKKYLSDKDVLELEDAERAEYLNWEIENTLKARNEDRTGKSESEQIFDACILTGNEDFIKLILKDKIDGSAEILEADFATDDLPEKTERRNRSAAVLSNKKFLEYCNLATEAFENAGLVREKASFKPVKKDIKGRPVNETSDKGWAGIMIKGLDEVSIYDIVVEIACYDDNGIHLETKKRWLKSLEKEDGTDATKGAIHIAKRQLKESLMDERLKRLIKECLEEMKQK